MPSVFESAESAQANQTSIKDKVSGYFQKNKPMVSIQNSLTFNLDHGFRVVRRRCCRPERNQNGTRIQSAVMIDLSFYYLIK